MTFHTWGFEIGPLSVVWYDLWQKQWGLEVTWRHRSVWPRPKPLKYDITTSEGAVRGTFVPTETKGIRGLQYAVMSGTPLQCFCRKMPDDPPCEMSKTGICPSNPKLWPEVIE